LSKIRRDQSPGVLMNDKPNHDSAVQHTRLNRPQPPGNLLVRPGLLKILNAKPTKELTIVVAPAGFGKTTLVSSWLETMPCPDSGAKTDCLPSTWLSIDKSDIDYYAFLRHFVAALQKIFPEACPDTLKMLQAANKIAKESMQMILTNEIADLPEHFILVLDDYHRANSPDINELLSGWIRHWPSPLHLVIISRTQPPLPLAGLKSKDQLSEVRSRDLRFLPQEAADYISMMTKIDPHEKNLSALLDYFEGWVAGLKLLSLALNKAGADQTYKALLNKGETDITGYLADEVFSQMADPLQRLLMKISILESFTPSLCQLLLDSDEYDSTVKHFLSNLNSSELFITALDSEGKWYRFHQLLRDMLKQQLVENFSKGQINILHLRAANWYAENNMAEKALEHAIKTDNRELLAKVAQEIIFSALNNDDRQLLGSVMQKLTEEIISSSPQFLLTRAWQKLHKWDLQSIHNIVKQVEVILEREKGPSLDSGYLYGQLAAFKGLLAYTANDNQSGVKFCAKALELLPTQWNSPRGLTIFYLGLNMQACEGNESAVNYLQNSYRETVNKESNLAQRHLFALSLVCIQDGNLKQAEQYARLLLNKAGSFNMLILEGYAQALLGLVNYLWNNLDQALQWYKKLFSISQFTMITPGRHGYVGLALVLQAKGSAKEALAIIDELCDIEIELYGQVTGWTESVRMQILTCQDRWSEAELWADSYSKPFADAPLIDHLIDPQVCRAKILIARNDHKDYPVIRNNIAHYMDIAQKTNNNRALAESLALLAMAEMNEGHEARAWDALSQSVEIAARGSMVRLYLDLGPQMQRLLQQISVKQKTDSFVDDILTAFSNLNGNSCFVDPGSNDRILPGLKESKLSLYENLTAREMEVLQLMSEAISLKDISDRLFISYSTAKRHTINIYSKLEVHNRWEAVSFAKKNGII
jgi:LuxR family transcriptional regulator, maltose regulon positive regulatory protein